jgi:putative oxidoreductase
MDTVSMSQRKETAMSRYLTISLLALAAAATSPAFADDITVDNTVFASTRTRADVQAELQQFKQAGASSYWAVPAPQAMVQQLMFWKNVGIFGGLVLLAGVGGGRFSMGAVPGRWLPATKAA